jgi:hypothetical protein
MFVTQRHGFPIYEPASDAELSSWRPEPGELLQFVKISRREYWVFRRGDFLGSASHLDYAQSWKVVSNQHGVCAALFGSLLECAECLLLAARHNGESPVNSK